MLCIVCGNEMECNGLDGDEAFICPECAEDMGIDLEEWEDSRNEHE